MPELLTGAELALLHVSAKVLGITSLTASVRIEGRGSALALRQAARLLKAGPAPVDLLGSREGSTLVVRLTPSNTDPASHGRWIAAMIAKNQEAFGVSGERGELLAIGDPFAPPVGEARWAELEAWQRDYLGNAWGGGLGPPLYNFDPPIGVGYAAVIELRATAGGVASARV